MVNYKVCSPKHMKNEDVFPFIRWFIIIREFLKSVTKQNKYLKDKDFVQLARLFVKSQKIYKVNY